MKMLDHTFAAGNLRLHCAVGPDSGPPLLLLHGVCRGWRDWSPILSSVQPRWKVWAPDARGHGDSDRAAGAYKVNDYIGDALAIIAQLDEPALIWGHSLGAMVAAAVAAEAPDAVRGLFLEDPPYHTMGQGILATPYHALFTGMRKLAREGGEIAEIARRMAEIRIPAMSGTADVRLGDIRTADSIRFSAECLVRLDPDVLTPLVEGAWLDGHDYRGVFTKIRCPVLLVQADATVGGALRDEDAALAESLIARCTRVRLKGVGHQAHWLDKCGILQLFHSFAEPLR